MWINHSEREQTRYKVVSTWFHLVEIVLTLSERVPCGSGPETSCLSNRPLGQIPNMTDFGGCLWFLDDEE